MHEIDPEMLSRAIQGDPQAGSRLLAAVYDDLRAIAGRAMREQANGRILLQPTALVHEAYLKILERTPNIESKTHFCAVAAMAMRQILVDHARAQNRVKRGGDLQRITLTSALAVAATRQVDLLDLDEALQRLAELDPRAAKVVELRFFGGLTEPQVADAIGVSERTVRNDWSMARAWLRCELGQESVEDAAS